MKKRYIVFILALVLFIMTGCADNKTQTVKIAIMGNSAKFYPGFKDGIEKAAEDVSRVYADSGYNVVYEFYDSDGSYERGAAIIDELSNDKSVTAVIGAANMEINKTAAYIFNKKKKLFIVPYFLYDSVYSDNYYTTVISMCHSAKTVGEMLRQAAAKTDARRWAVCTADSEFERAEMNGFLQYRENDGITVVDCADIVSIKNKFDETYKRWEALGVEGVIMLPRSNEGFEILKMLKRRNPQLVCGGDTAFDNSSLLDDDEELRQAMAGFIIVEEFPTRILDDEDKARLSEILREYKNTTGRELDTWFCQGYNAFRMAADTAIENKTCNSLEIAQLLHKNGYRGLIQDFEFDEYGAQTQKSEIYYVFEATGTATEYQFTEQE